MGDGRGMILGLGRRGFVAAVLALIGLVLVACSGNTDPFGKEGPTTATPKGKTPPAIMIRSMAGIPPQQARDLKTVLAVSAGQHDVGIVEGSLPGGTFSLEGAFSAMPVSGGTKIGFQWTLRDTNGVMVDQPQGEEVAPAAAAGSDPWSAVTPDVLQRIADKTAQAIAQKLLSMGFATRVSTLVTPPTETFALAGPGASQDIDYETLNGPGTADPALTASAPAMVDVPAGTPVAAAAPKSADNGPKTVIKAVAVIPVTGAPGPGNDELTRAMRQTLTAAGWPVLPAPRADALTIAGEVRLAAASGTTQTVNLSWVVKHPGGSTLGDIKQSNQVPAGSLDKGFGSSATAVTEAAATGIFNLIRKYR